MEGAAEMFSLEIEGDIIPSGSCSIDGAGDMNGVTVVVRRVVEQVTSDSISRCGSTGFIANWMGLSILSASDMSSMHRKLGRPANLSAVTSSAKGGEERVVSS